MVSEVAEMFQSRKILIYGTKVSQVSSQMNCKMDAQTSNPHFDWDSADLVGKWEAFRPHAEFMLKGYREERTKKKSAAI